MNNAISNPCFMNMTHLRIADIKTDILSMFVPFILKITMEAKKIVLESQLKYLNIAFLALPPLFKFVPRI